MKKGKKSARLMRLNFPGWLHRWAKRETMGNKPEVSIDKNNTDPIIN